MRNKALLLLAAGAALVMASPAAALPDWSGDWVVQPFKDTPPPYTAGWAAKAKAELGGKPAEDPIATCGVLPGMPRMLGVSGIHEWIVTPGGVRHALENYSRSVQRIFTDGRAHAKADIASLSYTGDNTGRWEGDTLVVDTLYLKDDTWLDELGHGHSDQTRVVTRVRKLADGRLEARARIEDPAAFTKPWTVTRYYERLPAGSFVRDYACGGIIRSGEQAKEAAKVR